MEPNRKWETSSLPVIDGVDEDMASSFMGGKSDLVSASSIALGVASGNSRQIVGSVNTTFSGSVKSVTNYYINKFPPSAEDLQRQKFREILDWLAPQPQVHRDILKGEVAKRLDGTGAWFFDSDSYHQWLSGEKPLLWVTGGFGTGKTVLCSSVVSSLQTAVSQGHFKCPEASVCFFFFSSQDTSRQSLSVLLKVILGQLCKPCIVPKPLRALYKRCQEVYPLDNPSTGELREALIQTLRIQCDAKLKARQDVFILIDALDQIPNSQLEPVTNLLQDLSQLGLSGLRVLCTSRHQPDLDLALSSPVRWQHHVMDRASIARDIEMFVLNALKSSKLRSLGQHAKTDILERAAREGDGMFRLTALKIAVLKDLPLRGPQDVSRVLSTLPAVLCHSYASMLANIPRTVREIAFRAFKWVVAAKRPLFIEEVIEAVYIRTDSPLSEDQHSNRCPASDLIQLFRGLVSVYPGIEDYESIPPRRHAIEFSHDSIREFLTGTDIRDTVAASFGFSIAEANDAVGRGCIVYMYQCKRYEIDPNEDTSPLLSYAWYNWDKHLEYDGFRPREAASQASAARLLMRLKTRAETAEALPRTENSSGIASVEQSRRETVLDDWISWIPSEYLPSFCEALNTAFFTTPCREYVKESGVSKLNMHSASIRNTLDPGIGTFSVSPDLDPTKLSYCGIFPRPMKQAPLYTTGSYTWGRQFSTQQMAISSTTDQE